MEKNVIKRICKSPKNLGILFDIDLKPLINYPVVLFQDEQIKDYFFLSFKIAKNDVKLSRGEIKIAKETNNLQDVDVILDTTQIYWASQEVFESVLDKQEIYYTIDVFSKEVSFEIFRKVYKNINEKPPFVSLMKLEMNENNQIVPNLLYCNEILYEMTSKKYTPFDNEEKKITTNEKFLYKIKQISAQIYFEGGELFQEIDEENPNYILEQRRKMFPNVKHDSILPVLEKGQKIFKDTKLRPAYFERIQEKESWLVSNYGEDWEVACGFYEQYKELAEMKKTESKK